jgi:hypothetical protein
LERQNREPRRHSPDSADEHTNEARIYLFARGERPENENDNDVRSGSFTGGSARRGEGDDAWRCADGVRVSPLRRRYFFSFLLAMKIDRCG